MGRTFTGLLRQSRMARARLLLRRSRRSLVEVAAACGFRSTRGLRRAFRKWHGISPSEYRRGEFCGRWSAEGRRLLRGTRAYGGSTLSTLST